MVRLIVLVGVLAAGGQCRAQSYVTSIGSCLKAVVALQASAPPETNPNQKDTTKPQNWNFHLQNTDILQSDPAFHAKYSGPNSLDNGGETQHTETLDLFGGRRLWQRAELHVDGLFWQGFGLSKTLGVEDFPNGDAYKFGTNTPYFMFARLFIRQVFGLGGPKEDVPDTALSLAGKQDISRITLNIGRFTPTDVIDTNSYASSPHTQFLSWGLINNLAWDYPADSVGYAPGFTVELNQPQWSLRTGWFILPKIPNSFTGDDEFLMWPHEGNFGPIFEDWSWNNEFEKRYTAKGHPGSLRFLAWVNQANMAPYPAATAILKADGPNGDWQAARSFRYKYGFGLNWEQELTKNVGLFSRLGWNDGHEEAWVFTDANWSASLGTSLKGEPWHRPDDVVGIAGIASGASPEQQRFLEAGGTGILDGDGALSYAPEGVLESYYDAKVGKNLRLAFDYQFVANPAFNTDRGPVSIFALRLHYEF
jgi:high affinity Mn2+ porin